MTEYTINKLLVLKLENGKTIIYVNGKRFRQCKRLMINIQKQDIPVYDEIDSIDEAVDTFKLSLWESIQNETIIPEQEFWGHCSNLQAWYDHDYDTRLLHSNLAFPLLKALVDAGDNDAKRMFKTEILERLESGHPNVIKSVLSSGLLNYFTDEEKKQLLQHHFKKHYPNIFLYFFEEKLLAYLDQEGKKNLVQQNYPIVLKYIQDIKSPDHLIYVFNSRILDYLNPEDKKQLIHQKYLILFENLHHILKPVIAKIPYLYPHIIRYIFEERLFDYLTPTEKEPLIRNNFPILLDCIEKITWYWGGRFGLQELKEIISDDTLVYLYLTVFYAIKGTELINDFLTTIVKSLGSRKHDIILLILKEEFDKLKENLKKKELVIGESLGLQLYRKEVEFHPIHLTKKQQLFLEKINRKSISKNIITCVQCGMHLSADYAFCDKCGTKIVSDFTPSTKPPSSAL